MVVRQLSKRDVRRYLDVLRSFGLENVIGKVRRGFEVILKSGIVIYLESEPVLVKIDDYILPFIGLAGKSSLKRVYVDRGAVKPITNGADIMAPGIVKYDVFREGELVSVCVEGLDTVIAVGIALVESNELDKMSKGKVIKNLHYLSDMFWNSVRSKKF